jgi:hypothetical protein
MGLLITASPQQFIHEACFMLNRIKNVNIFLSYVMVNNFILFYFIYLFIYMVKFYI